MKRITSLLLSFGLILCISACGKNAPTWQEQYDLGLRYLSEGNYEEAILAFEAAIEIDPRQENTYLSLAEAYTAQGATDKAAEILARAVEVIGVTAALTEAQERLSAQISASLTQESPPLRTERITRSDGSYYIEEYNADNLMVHWIYCDTDGNTRTEHTAAPGNYLSYTVWPHEISVSEYNRTGAEVFKYIFTPEGKLRQWMENDANEHSIRWIYYDNNGNVLVDHPALPGNYLSSAIWPHEIWVSEYDHTDAEVFKYIFTPEGKLRQWMENDANEHSIHWIYYDDNGNVLVDHSAPQGHYLSASVWPHAIWVSEHDSNNTKLRTTIYNLDGTVNSVSEH